MVKSSRIPLLSEYSFKAACTWFDDLLKSGLLFHPEDDPAEIVSIRTGQPTFNKDEISQLRNILDVLEKSIGHELLMNAAYPAFQKAFTPN